MYRVSTTTTIIVTTLLLLLSLPLPLLGRQESWQELEIEIKKRRGMYYTLLHSTLLPLQRGRFWEEEGSHAIIRTTCLVCEVAAAAAEALIEQRARRRAAFSSYKALMDWDLPTERRNEGCGAAPMPQKLL